MRFGKIVENLRQLYHPTLDRFCRSTNVEKRFIESIEQGVCVQLTDEQIIALATALELPRESPNWLRFVRAASTAAYAG